MKNYAERKFFDFGVDMAKDKNLPEPGMDYETDFLPRELQEEIDRRECLLDVDPDQDITKMNTGQRKVF